MAIKGLIKVSRPTRIIIEPRALLHNVTQIRRFAPGKKIIAMIKANAYGCGVRAVAPVLEGQVDAFGVGCLEEALTIRALGCRTPCLLMQGVFSTDELETVAKHQCSLVVHHEQQVQWLLNTPLAQPLSLWIKVNTGMHRLGFKPGELGIIVSSLSSCAWIDKKIGLMTHLACADEPERIENRQQISLFEGIDIPGFSQRSMANSAAIIALAPTHYDVVRPGLMLYGVSPFADRSATELGLIPAMRFSSAISAIHDYPSSVAVGYSATWNSTKPSVIGIVAAGYGDGYPRHIAPNTPVWVAGQEVPIVGRVSMDMMAIDLTQHPKAQLGDPVELWGTHIAVERIAKAAGTSAYELLCQVTERPRQLAPFQ